MALPRFDRVHLIGNVLWILAFLALVMLARTQATALAAGSRERIVLALLPAAPLLAGVLLEIRYLLRLDELQLRIWLFALIGGTYCSMSVALVAWLLESLAGLPRIAPYTLFLVFAVTTWLGYFVARWRYR